MTRQSDTKEKAGMLLNSHKSASGDLTAVTNVHAGKSNKLINRTVREWWGLLNTMVFLALYCGRLSKRYAMR